MNVVDVMTPNPDALGPSASIMQAARLMRDGDYGVVAITNNTGALLGVVTDRDIAIKAVAAGEDPNGPIQEVMTTNPECVGPETPVDQAMNLMSSRQIRRLPVVSNGQLIGIVALADLATSSASTTNKAGVLESVSAPR